QPGRLERRDQAERGGGDPRAQARRLRPQRPADPAGNHGRTADRRRERALGGGTSVPLAGRPLPAEGARRRGSQRQWQREGQQRRRRIQAPPPPSPALEAGEELTMELHERIQTTARPLTGSDGRDPFSELKNRIHLALINELGPQLFTVGTGPAEVRTRVESDLKERLQQEQGLSREDRERLLGEITDDVVGYGPLERVLADESVSEIMVNGAHEIWVERQGRLYETTLRFTDDS